MLEIPPAGPEGSLNANIVNGWEQPLARGQAKPSSGEPRQSQRCRRGEDVYFDGTIRYDESFSGGLNRVVQREPWLARDHAMIDTLRSLGIEESKPVAPTSQMTPGAEEGIREADQQLAARFDAGLMPFFETPGGRFRPHPNSSTPRGR